MNLAIPGVRALRGQELIDARRQVERKIAALSQYGTAWPPSERSRSGRIMPRGPGPNLVGGSRAALAELVRMRLAMRKDLTKGDASFWPPSDAQRFIDLITAGLKGHGHG